MTIPFLRGGEIARQLMVAIQDRANNGSDIPDSGPAHALQSEPVATKRGQELLGGKYREGETAEGSETHETDCPASAEFTGARLR